MQNMRAESAKTTAEKAAAGGVSRDNGAGSNNLGQRYRQIGISAVAAAVRYQGTAKNPAYAPAPTNSAGYTGEAA